MKCVRTRWRSDLLHQWWSLCLLGFLHKILLSISSTYLMFSFIWRLSVEYLNSLFFPPKHFTRILFEPIVLVVLSAVNRVRVPGGGGGDKAVFRFYWSDTFSPGVIVRGQWQPWFTKLFCKVQIYYTPLYIGPPPPHPPLSLSDFLSSDLKQIHNDLEC